MPKKNDLPTPMELETFPERLRLARRWADLGVNELGILSGSSGAVVSRAESGERIPETAIVVRIANALGVRIGWLLSGEDPMVSPIIGIEADSPSAAQCAKNRKAQRTRAKRRHRS